jgi:hypothetical protein
MDRPGTPLVKPVIGHGIFGPPGSRGWFPPMQ